MKDGGNNIRTIGLILEDAFTDFASDIIHSVSLVVKDLKDVRLVVIPGRQDDSKRRLQRAKNAVLFNPETSVSASYARG